MKQQVLSLTNTVTPAASKTNIFHTFQLDQAYEALEIRFSYLPKVHPGKAESLRLIQDAMEIYAPPPYENAYGKAEDYLPIVNLLTLSLEDPHNYRGCAHRHDDTQVHMIQADFASPGFYKGPVMAGVWRIGINLHCVVTPVCTYSLEVYVGEAAEK